MSKFKVRDWVIYEGHPYQIALILGDDCLLIVPKGFKTAFQLNASSIPGWRALLSINEKHYDIIQAEELIHVASVYYYWATPGELSSGIIDAERAIKKEIGL